MELQDLRTSLHGYNKQDVYRYVNEQNDRCQQLEKENAGLRQKLQEYENREKEQAGNSQSLASILVQAEEFSRQIQAQAEQEAGQLKEKAEEEAREICRAAQEEAQRLQKEAEEAILQKKQQAVQLLAAASQKASEEERRLQEAHAQIQKARAGLREALRQTDELLAGIIPQPEQPSGQEESGEAGQAEE